MTTLYICRHGETENNKNKRLSGWIDTPLTTTGIQNTQAIAAKLQDVAFDKVVSSDLGRAFITAYLVLQELGSNTEIERTSRLREVNYGDLGNQSYVDPNSAYPKLTPEENAHFIPQGGESLVRMQTRVVKFVAELTEANSGKTILVFAHDGTINALHAYYKDENIGLTDAASHNAHDFVAKIVYEKGNITSFVEV